MKYWWLICVVLFIGGIVACSSKTPRRPKPDRTMNHFGQLFKRDGGGWSGWSDNNQTWVRMRHLADDIYLDWLLDDQDGVMSNREREYRRRRIIMLYEAAGVDITKLLIIDEAPNLLGEGKNAKSSH